MKERLRGTGNQRLGSTYNMKRLRRAASLNAYRFFKRLRSGKVMVSGFLKDRSNSRILSNRYTMSNSPHRLRCGFLRLLFGCGYFILLFIIWQFTEIPRLISEQLPETRFGGNGLVDVDRPPNWDRLYQWENELPQHNLSLPHPEGQTGRYVHFANQIQMIGWNNQLAEIKMNSWLAYKSDRAYVFQDSIWEPSHYPWPHSTYLGVPRTPLNALLSGPIVGGAWNPTDNHPRSISRRWYETICPKSERRIISTRHIESVVGTADGTVIFAAWEKALKDAPERCVEVQGNLGTDTFSQTAFDIPFLTSPRILSLWEEFKASPVSQLLGASPLVSSAVDRNEYLFVPRGPRPPVPAPVNPYERMLAVHLRRGDFEGHCRFLAKTNASFYEWNQLEFLPDRFTHPSKGTSQEDTERIYVERCLPDPAHIITSIHNARDQYIHAAKEGEYRYLDIIFLATNDHTLWVEDLKDALTRVGWQTIVTTKDLRLDSEQKEVGMAVDMELARRAAVFVGNGWSSYTSNVVHSRLVDGRETIANRFF